MDTECGVNCKRDCTDNCKNYSLKRSLFNALQQHGDLFGHREDLMMQTVENFTEIIDSMEDNNIKDNPVPSLDKTKIENAFKENFWNGKFVELHSGDYERIVEIILELQNGVETNKEQPKYLVIHSNYPIAFCSDKKKFLEEEMPDDEERELTEFVPIKLGNIDD